MRAIMANRSMQTSSGTFWTLSAWSSPTASSFGSWPHWGGRTSVQLAASRRRAIPAGLVALLLYRRAFRPDVSRALFHPDAARRGIAVRRGRFDGTRAALAAVSQMRDGLHARAGAGPALGGLRQEAAFYFWMTPAGLPPRLPGESLRRGDCRRELHSCPYEPRRLDRHHRVGTGDLLLLPAPRGHRFHLHVLADGETAVRPQVPAANDPRGGGGPSPVRRVRQPEGVLASAAGRRHDRPNWFIEYQARQLKTVGLVEVDDAFRITYRWDQPAMIPHENVRTVITVYEPRSSP